MLSEARWSDRGKSLNIIHSYLARTILSNLSYTNNKTTWPAGGRLRQSASEVYCCWRRFELQYRRNAVSLCEFIFTKLVPEGIQLPTGRVHRNCSSGQLSQVRHRAGSGNTKTRFGVHCRILGAFQAHQTQLMARLYHKAARSEEGMASVARVYADINENKPQDYWDYENYTIEWGCVTCCSTILACE